MDKGLSLWEFVMIIVQVAAVATFVTAVVEFFARAEEGIRRNKKHPPGRALSRYLEFTAWLGKDYIAFFWTIVALAVVYGVPIFTLPIPDLTGWRFWLVILFLSPIATAVAAKVGHDWIIKFVAGRLGSVAEGKQ